MDGIDNYGSPFDEIYPWNKMVRVTDEQAGELVAIPKYWFKWTRTSTTMQLEVANYAAEGFHTSPMHADREDGYGERDIVYAARYKCCASDYKSTSGELPKFNMTKSEARAAIAALGDGIYQSDFAMWWTIRMLYLVEYADWDAINMIGYGVLSENPDNMGTSDEMPYHTGCMGSSRTESNSGVQYRYLEGLASNGYELIDGIYSFQGKKNQYIIKNPLKFSDNSNGVSVVAITPTDSCGYTTKYSDPQAEGYEYTLFPITNNGDNNTPNIFCSLTNLVSNGIVVLTGRAYSTTPTGWNMFMLNTAWGLSGYNKAAHIGCRLMKLPNIVEVEDNNLSINVINETKLSLDIVPSTYNENQILAYDDNSESVKDIFTRENLKVYSYIDDKYSIDVTDECTFYPEYFSESGKQSVLITYEDKDLATSASILWNVNVELLTKAIYGATWDGNDTTKWTRTDTSSDFTDPVPYVAGATEYGSPFDSIYPWKNIVRVTDDEAGELVEIPKFWFKWTRNGTSMQLQIANYAADGFYVSPAHADRGDGYGERDIVYVGRYHSGSDYKSSTAQMPVSNMTRGTTRSAIHTLGDTIWSIDFAMFWTIRMLYLVEFADWDSQAKIGAGAGNGSSAEAVGTTDAMPYHTGTMQASRETYGVGCQYRYIEGLWENVFDWCDGIYFDNSTVYCIKIPADFSDTTGGTIVGSGSKTDGFIRAWTDPTVNGFEYALYPSDCTGDFDTPAYVGDGINVSSTYGQTLYSGSCYTLTSARTGMFQLGAAYKASGSPSCHEAIGCRVMKLPNKTT